VVFICTGAGGSAYKLSTASSRESSTQGSTTSAFGTICAVGIVAEDIINGFSISSASEVLRSPSIGIRPAAATCAICGDSIEIADAPVNAAGVLAFSSSALCPYQINVRVEAVNSLPADVAQVREERAESGGERQRQETLVEPKRFLGFCVFALPLRSSLQVEDKRNVVLYIYTVSRRRITISAPLVLKCNIMSSSDV
jgi:hypothetical protein